MMCNYAIAAGDPGGVGGSCGRPQSVADLEQHNTIAYRQIKGGGIYRWELLATEHLVVTLRRTASRNAS